MSKLKEKNEPIVEIIKDLRDSYESYRIQHEKSEIEGWVQKFKAKHKVKDLDIDIYFNKAWGSGPAELEKINILFMDRSSELYYYRNKRPSGGYYLIISELHKDKVNIRIDFSDALAIEWYNGKDVEDLIEREIYIRAVEDLKNNGNNFKHINSKENSYLVEISNTLNEYIQELKQVINNYPKVMEEYLQENKELDNKYDKLWIEYKKNDNRKSKQGKLFTKFIWALIFEKTGIEPNIKNSMEINTTDENELNVVEANSNENKEYNFINNDEFNKIINLLIYKKNIILEGVPGVGKTYIAKKIASEFTSNKEENIKVIQFHQSYAYEDFVQGLRPTNEGTFEAVDGVLKVICDKARNDIDNKYVIIIDEINRGNISKIFGETFMLIEKDKRITKEQIEANESSKYAVTLPYSKNKDEKFDIPENVYFIGTMNTMDRSIALMDFALRRRFAVYEIKPCFEDEEGAVKFQDYLNDVNNNNLRILVEKIKSINNSKYLDGIKFGHSYFCGLNKYNDVDNKVDFVINYEIIPQLKEYLLNDTEKIEKLYRFLNVNNTQILSVDTFLNKDNHGNDGQDGENADE